MNDLISVIIPVYNVEEYLEQCLNSVLKQTYKNIEIILIDDGSKDNSGIICDDFEKKDNRVKVIHKPNQGVSSARNRGLEESKGKWIGFVDSDDWLEPSYFEELLECAKKNKADIVGCGYNRAIGNKKEAINNSGEIKTLNSKEFLIKILNPQSGYGFTHMKIYKKDIIQNLLFDTELTVGEDSLFNEQVTLNVNKVCVLEKSLYNYRINPKSVVKRYDSNYAQKYLKSMKTNKEYLIKIYGNNEEIMQNYYNYVAFHVMLIAVNYCYSKQSNVKNKNNHFKEICKYEEYEEGIKKSNYNNLSITRKITLFTIKHKLFFLTNIICSIRNKQNNK